MHNVATLGGGCYWCLEAFYQRIRGVKRVVSGYSGGHFANPTTDDVYYKDTGHAEVVQLTFDPDTISYREILEIFFVMHDPTTLNRQGPDVGSIYRSIILYHDDQQKQIAEDMIANFAPTLYKDPIVTELRPFEKFWPAAEYMQNSIIKIRDKATAWWSLIPKSRSCARNLPPGLRSSCLIPALTFSLVTPVLSDTKDVGD